MNGRHVWLMCLVLGALYALATAILLPAQAGWIRAAIALLAIVGLALACGGLLREGHASEQAWLTLLVRVERGEPPRAIDQGDGDPGTEEPRSPGGAERCS